MVVCVFHKALVERFDRGLFYVRSVENFREPGSVIKNGVDPSSGLSRRPHSWLERT